MIENAAAVIPSTTRLPGLLRQLRNNKFAKNLLSMGTAQLAIRFSRLLATIVLSRILLPKDFALAAVVLTVYEFIALFTRNGITAKIVQAAPEDVEAVAQTAHRMTWVLCAGLMLVQCLIAWPVAWIYDDKSLILPIAAMALIYLASPLSNIQGAFQQREGSLGRVAMGSATQVISDNVLTAIFALMGLGLWAIILPKILVAPIWVAFIRYGHAWRPKNLMLPSYFHNWQEIARFSRSVMGVEILTTFQSNFDNLLVGYFLGLHALGIYYFAFNGGLGITLGLITAAGFAVYPHLCEVSQQPAALAARFSQTRRTVALAVVPLVVLQASLAPIYVPLIFGQRWNEAVPILSLICLSAMARPFATVSSQLLRAVGRPDIEFKWQLRTTALLAVALLVAVQVSILAVAIAVFAVQVVMLGSFAYFAPKKALASFLTKEATA